MRWLAFCLLFVPVAAGARPPDFAALARSQSPAVVNIASAYAAPPVLPDVPHDESLIEFLERLALELEGESVAPPLGSGFIISPDGEILTNYHVVEEAFGEDVIVRLADGRELVARVVGMDRPTDIALLKVEASGLPAVRIGDPRKLEVGEWVVAIGSPFGFERSLAAGVVSALARSIPIETHIHFIQSDVAMNPGTSGGPLFNARGEVVGVNSLIFSNTGSSIGLSFAVPIDEAMKVVHALRRDGKVTRGRIGVRLQALTPTLATAFGLPAETKGALVSDVEPGGPAARAGLRSGDVLLTLAGREVASHEGALELIAGLAPGSTAAAEVVRNGEPMQVALEVEAAAPARRRLPDAHDRDRLGFTLSTLSEAQRRRFAPQGGVLVQRAYGAARRAGVMPGDIILGVNGRSTRSVASFRAEVEKALPGDTVALLVLRYGGRVFLPLRIP